MQPRKAIDLWKRQSKTLVSGHVMVPRAQFGALLDIAKAALDDHEHELLEPVSTWDCAECGVDQCNVCDALRAFAHVVETETKGS